MSKKKPGMKPVGMILHGQMVPRKLFAFCQTMYIASAFKELNAQCTIQWAFSNCSSGSALR